MATEILTDTRDPISLGDRIDARFNNHGVISSNGRRLIFLEAPIGSVNDPSLGSDALLESMPKDPQDKIGVRLVTSDSKRIVHLTIRPKNLQAPATIWRAELSPEGEIELISRNGHEKDSPVITDPSTIRRIGNIVDYAQTRKTPEELINIIRKNYILRISAIWDPEEKKLGMEAVSWADIHHAGQKRETEDPYLVHPAAVVNGLLDAGISTTSIINASWLHDVPEDSPSLKQKLIAQTKNGPIYEPFEPWAKRTEKFIAESFGEETAHLVMLVTRPKVDGITVFNKEQAHEMHQAQVASDVRAILLRMFDSLHNSRTIYVMRDEQIRAKIRRTKRDWWPIFENARTAYPEVTDYCMTEIERALRPQAESKGLDWDNL